MLRKTVGLVALALAATLPTTLLVSANAVSVVLPQPNVVLILVDDARVDDLTTTPEIVRRIGKPGVTFSGAVSSFPLCCPARASLLTGQYPHNHGVLGNEAPLGGWTKFKDANTLATWLDPQYETAWIGKYLNEYTPPYVPPGWDYWAVPRATYNYRYDLWSVLNANRTLPGYQTDTVGTLASRFITRQATSDEPFFLNVSIVGPHSGSPVEHDDPSLPTPNVADRYRNTFAGMANSDPSFNEADVSDKPVKPTRLTPAQIAAETEVNAQRREAMLSVQDAVTQVVDTLASTGELDNTYLWFISDNGYLMGEHRILSGKVAPYEVSVRVPMLLRGPGIAARTTVDRPVGLVDFAATVLAMTGRTAAQGPYPLDGVNLLRMITRPNLHTHRPVLIEAGPRSRTASPTDPYHYHGIITLIGGTEWKYLVRSTGAKELYNLTLDPFELTNMAGTPALSAVQRQLQGVLTAYQWCSGAQCRLPIP